MTTKLNNEDYEVIQIYSIVSFIGPVQYFKFHDNIMMYIGIKFGEDSEAN